LDPLTLLANGECEESGEEKEGSQALETGLLLHRKVLLPVGCLQIRKQKVPILKTESRELL